MTSYPKNVEGLRDELMNSWAELHAAAKVVRAELERTMRLVDDMERTVDRELQSLLGRANDLVLEVADEDSHEPMASDAGARQH